jgi:hypothetical protein
LVHCIKKNLATLPIFSFRGEGEKAVKSFVKNFGWKTGLPDFSWYNIPKRVKDIPNHHKRYQMATK